MHRRPLPFARPALGIVSLLILSVISTSSFATICRVKTDGTGGVDGSDWDSNALALQAALSEPSCIGPGNEIWVKQGVYRAATDIMFRDLSIIIPAGAQVYGGFAGIETLRTQRDPDSYPTIFSGDITGDDTDGNGDDIIDDANDINGSNSMHVVLLDGNTTPITADTVLDGLIITAGQAMPSAGNDDGSTAFFGGGLLCQAAGSLTAECSPTLTHLRVVGNIAGSLLGGLGGGFACLAQDGGTCNPTIADSLFSGNRATVGAAISVAAVGVGGDIPSAGLTISNSRFGDNHAEVAGGALVFGGTGTGINPSLSISGSEFLNNRSDSTDAAGAVSGGGAIVLQAALGTSLTMDIHDTAFNGNQAGTYGDGGALLAMAGDGEISVTLKRVGFAENAAGGDGGAILLRATAFTYDGQPDPTCSVSGNSQIYSSIGNVTFSSNVAANGGAMALDTGPDCELDADLVNVTASGNSASSAGNGINFVSAPLSSLNVTNTILWGNGIAGVPQIETGGVSPTEPSINTSVIQGGCPSGANCSTVLDLDPLLSAAADHGGPGFTFVPDPAGSAVDAGFSLACTTSPVDAVDQRGVTRPQGAECDIGAVEYRYDTFTLDVSVAGPGTVDVNTPPDPSAGGIVDCAQASGSCSADYSGENNALEPLQLVATPATGYHVEWGGDCAADGSVTLQASTSCSASFVINTWGIGGSISGLGANGLILSLSADGGNIFEAIAPTSGSTVFAFAAEVPFGADYAVSINNQPAGHSCQINNASGPMPDADVNDVQVICSLPPEIFADGFE